MNAFRGMGRRFLSAFGLGKVLWKLDRRRSRRYPMDLPVRFRMVLPPGIENASPYFPGQTCDLSMSGMGLLADTISWGNFHILNPWPATMEQCLLEIQLACDDRPLRVIGRAVWYMQVEEGGPFAFRMGVHFSDLTPELSEQIKGYIDRYAVSG